MNYELAKQLKEAGFPQTGQLVTHWEKPNGGITEFIDGPICFPTLSELIEACDGRMEELSSMSHSRERPKWGAHSYICEECGWNRMESGYGSTPEEAVAKLWLKLNK